MHIGVRILVSLALLFLPLVVVWLTSGLGPPWSDRLPRLLAIGVLAGAGYLILGAYRRPRRKGPDKSHGSESGD